MDDVEQSDGIRNKNMRNVIGFHNPDEAYGFLSNWYLSDFVVDDVKYTSMEQYMMYQKAIYFEDENIAVQILNTSNVGKIKALGRSVSNYNDSIWNGMRQVIVYNGLIEKLKRRHIMHYKILKKDDKPI